MTLALNRLQPLNGNKSITKFNQLENQYLFTDKTDLPVDGFFVVDDFLLCTSGKFH